MGTNKLKLVCWAASSTSCWLFSHQGFHSTLYFEICPENCFTEHTHSTSMFQRHQKQFHSPDVFACTAWVSCSPQWRLRCYHVSQQVLQPFLSININLSLHLLSFLHIYYTENLYVIWSWKVRDWKAGNLSQGHPTATFACSVDAAVTALLLAHITEQLRQVVQIWLCNNVLTTAFHWMFQLSLALQPTSEFSKARARLTAPDQQCSPTPTVQALARQMPPGHGLVIRLAHELQNPILTQHSVKKQTKTKHWVTPKQTKSSATQSLNPLFPDKLNT